MRRLQVAVTAPDAASAEVLSTALLVLGEREGIALLEALPDTEGLVIDAEGQRSMTRGWSEAVAFESLPSLADARP
jgi:thiamine biosynthesis lipoprotein ApbE